MANPPLDSGPSIRTFLALPLAASFGPDLASILRAIQPKIDGVKWVLPEQVHLTLHFFGSVDPEQIQNIDRIVSSVAARSKPLALGIDGIGCFPNENHAKIIWIGIAGDITRLLDLQREIETSLAAQGFPTESREFKPHATIGRARAPQGLRLTARELKPPAKTELQLFDELTLYQSTLLPTGPRYEPLKTFLLASK